jgi:hypothetical protein
MSSFDFNTAPEQRALDVIPDKTIAVVQLNIRAGNAGENGLLKRSKSGEAEGIDCEFTIAEGPYAKRKFFAFMVLSGATDGHAAAADITRSRLRAILESARGVKPADASEAARKARVAEYHEFNGMRFLARIGVEPARGEYRAKNILAEAITPDRTEWRPVEQMPRGTAPETAPIALVKPAWAS